MELHEILACCPAAYQLEHEYCDIICMHHRVVWLKENPAGLDQRRF